MREEGQGGEKKVREALKQVLYQNEMLLRWVNGAVITCDRDGRVVEANDEALNSLGWKRAELLGRQGHETFQHTTDDGSEYPWEFSPVFAAIEDGSSHHVDGDLFWKQDGSSFVADYIVSPVRDDEGEISGAMIIFRNLSEARMQEAQRIHGMKLESLGELSAGIAHEINTPIQFVGSNVTFLKEAFEDVLALAKACLEYCKSKDAESVATDSLREQLDALEEQADLPYLEEEIPVAFRQTAEGIDRVSALVQGLKRFAHSGDQKEKTAANINDIILNALIVSNNAYKYVAKVVTNLGDIPDIKVNAGDISQVILNLIVNAAQAIEEKHKETREMGEIGLVTRVEGGQVVVEVRDSGTGVPTKVKERIFDPFFTTKEVGRGSGQGLAISRTIVVNNHEGSIKLLSSSSAGSTFEVRLPV